MDKISVIIPVHNGKKYLHKLYKNVINQTYKNLEIIFVENFSKDNSYKVLQELANKDQRIVVLKCTKPGTSMARKMGVEYATGIYTVFMDQDDKYLKNDAIANMYKKATDLNVDVCQFLNYIGYKFGIVRKPITGSNSYVFTKSEILEKEIGSVFESYGGGFITPTVWSKFYKTDVLKDAIINIDLPLFFAEDQFLVTNCLLSNLVVSVGFVPEAYYVWNTGVGFSSSKNSELSLMQDYQKTKPIIDDLLVKHGASINVRYRLHLETLYFLLVYIKSQMRYHSKDDLISLIKELSSFEHVVLAKKFINSELTDDIKYDELIFLASDYTPEEYYQRFYLSIDNKIPLYTRIAKKLLN